MNLQSFYYSVLYPIYKVVINIYNEKVVKTFREDRKLKKKFLVIMMSVVMALVACTACGSQETEKKDVSSEKKTESHSSEKDENKNSESQKESEEDSSITSEIESEKGSDVQSGDGQVYVDLLAYYNSKDVQDGLQQLCDALKDTPLSLKVSATSDTITYEYSYKEDLGISTEEMKETMAENMKDQESVFVGLADSMLPFVLLDKVNIHVIYYSASGEVLYEGTFSSTK